MSLYDDGDTTSHQRMATQLLICTAFGASAKDDGHTPIVSNSSEYDAKLGGLGERMGTSLRRTIR